MSSPRFFKPGVDVVFPNETTAILTYHVRQGMSARGKGENQVQEMNDSSTWVQVDGGWVERSR